MSLFDNFWLFGPKSGLQCVSKNRIWDSRTCTPHPHLSWVCSKCHSTTLTNFTDTTCVENIYFLDSEAHLVAHSWRCAEHHLRIPSGLSEPVRVSDTYSPSSWPWCKVPPLPQGKPYRAFDSHLLSAEFKIKKEQTKRGSALQSCFLPFVLLLCPSPTPPMLTDICLCACAPEVPEARGVYLICSQSCVYFRFWQGLGMSLMLTST